MLFKVLVVIAVIYVIYKLVKKTSPITQEKEPPTSKKIGSDMVECPKCGVFFEQGSGVKKGVAEFCSNECAR